MAYEELCAGDVAARLSWPPDRLRLVVSMVSLLLTTLGAIHIGIHILKKTHLKQVSLSKL